MEKTKTNIVKISILFMLLILLIPIAQSQTQYYDTYGAVTTTNEPIYYAQVVPMSIPLHFTFAIYDTVAIRHSAELDCNSKLYGVNSISCDTSAPTNNFESHNLTRYTYKWDMNFDAVVVAYEKDEPVPMLVGQGLTDSGTSNNKLLDPCEGDNLCYTEQFADITNPSEQSSKETTSSSLTDCITNCLADEQAQYQQCSADCYVKYGN